MSTHRLLGAGLVSLGMLVAGYAVLGPLVLDVIHFRTSASGLNQIRGGDLAALVVVPVCLAVGALAWRGHPAAPVLALAPAIFAMYTYSQLIRGSGVLLIVIAVFVVVGLHLPTLVDALGGDPGTAAYLDTPTAFWVVKFYDLGSVAPAALGVGVGRCEGAGGPGRPRTRSSAHMCCSAGPWPGWRGTSC